MRNFVLFVAAFFAAVSHGVCQVGTAADPFTSLHQASVIMSPGIYHFSLGGSTFSTFVDGNGYVMVAVDFGNGVGILPQTTNLTTSSRGILNGSSLSSLTEAVEVRISSSNGVVNATTTNNTIVNRVRNNSTLHRGSADNGINNSWSGPGSNRLTTNASCPTYNTSNLRRNIVHVCGNQGGFHWIPTENKQRIVHQQGEIGSGASFRLWVKGNPVVLPVELMFFDAKKVHDEVHLLWKTMTERNNDFFTVEKSSNLIDWVEVIRVNGAGNASNPNNYTAVDKEPFSGTSYYRLKQTDFNGEFKYFTVKSVDFSSIDNAHVHLYPNPTKGIVEIESTQQELENYEVYNSFGQKVTAMVKVKKHGKNRLVLDLYNLEPGVYFFKSKTQTNRLLKH